MPLLEAGERWLQQIARPDSGLSARTITDYSWTWQKYVDATTSSLRGLTLQQANDPQRPRNFLPFRTHFAEQSQPFLIRRTFPLPESSTS
jgi:hypothetical protein